MFWHLYSYKLKEIIRQKWIVGWTVLFPIALSTAFYFGFGQVIRDDPENFDPIPVALVAENETMFSDIVRELSEEGENQLFVLTEVGEDAAIELLEDEEIYGIYYDGDEPGLTVTGSGLQQSILSQFMKTYYNDQLIVEDIISKTEPEDIPEVIEKLTDRMASENEYVVENKITDKGISAYMQYFFSLLAMTSLFASWVSMSIMNGICANQTENGMRYECSPVAKLKAIVAGTMAGLTNQFFANIILVIYVEKILKLDFGIDPVYIVIVTTLGSAIGTTSGVMLNSFFGRSKSLSIAVPLIYSMVCSFLSGLMYGDMKQVIEVHAPIINRINPAAVISDALYAAGMYGVGDRYWKDITIMVVMVIVFAVVGSFRLRGRLYDSI